MAPLPHGRTGTAARFQDEGLDAALDEVGGRREPDGAGSDDGDGELLGAHGARSPWGPEGQRGWVEVEVVVRRAVAASTFLIPR